MATNFPSSPVNGQVFTASNINYVYTTAVSAWRVSTDNLTTSTTSTFFALNVTSNAESNSTSTGALIVKGGVGIGRNLNVGGNATIAGNSNVYGTASFAGASFSSTATFNNVVNIKTLQGGGPGGAATISGIWALGPSSSLQATYADLAECYQADAEYAPGTVLEFGGKYEVTVADDSTRRVAGVVSTNPAYLMNRQLMGANVVVIALTGRVPCKVRGKIQKGDMMVAAGGGYARAEFNPMLGSVIGKALEDFEGADGVIEVVVGRL